MTTDTREPIVTVRDLTISSQTTVLVQNITFALSPGHIVVMTGRSGAGKSTIVAAVSEALAPELRRSGTVDVDGGKRIGYLPQDGALTLNPARRIGAALGEIAALQNDSPPPWYQRRRWCQSAVDSALARAAFDPSGERLHRRFPFEFSGGQRVRIALAAILATNPDILILDEPSTGLDTVNRALLIQAIAAERDRGAAILITTHDEVVVAQLADEVVTVETNDDGLDGPDTTAMTTLDTRAIAPARSSPPLPLVHVEQLCCVRGSQQVLDRVTLSVGGGELIGLVGQSGAGKTTLLRSIAGLITPSAGSVAFRGNIIGGLSARSRVLLAEIGYVGQEVRASFQPDRRVRGQIALSASRLRDADNADERARALMQRLGLGADLGDRYPSELSGGQLRRCALARALITEPSLLLCDEAITGLDSPTIRLVLDEIDRVRERTGMAVILSSHDLHAVLRRTHRIVVIDHGRITDDIPGMDLEHASPTLRELLRYSELGQPGVVTRSDIVE